MLGVGTARANNDRAERPWMAVAVLAEVTLRPWGPLRLTVMADTRLKLLTFNCWYAFHREY